MTAAIRAASEHDAATLSALGRETFSSTFGHLYRDSDLESFLRLNHAADFYRRILADVRYGVWIAETVSLDPVGYAVAGPCSLPAPGADLNSGELIRLYVKKGAQGAGLGRLLLETAIDFLQRRFARVYLGVYAENRAAQKLYSAFGFEKVDEYFYMVGEHADPEWIMELKDLRRIAAA